MSIQDTIARDWQVLVEVASIILVLLGAGWKGYHGLKTRIDEGFDSIGKRVFSHEHTLHGTTGSNGLSGEMKIIRERTHDNGNAILRLEGAVTRHDDHHTSHHARLKRLEEFPPSAKEVG